MKKFLIVFSLLGGCAEIDRDLLTCQTKLQDVVNSEIDKCLVNVCLLQDCTKDPGSFIRYCKAQHHGWEE